jgi:hypothetical protein
VSDYQIPAEVLDAVRDGASMEAVRAVAAAAYRAGQEQAAADVAAEQDHHGYLRGEIAELQAELAAANARLAAYESWAEGGAP